MKSRGLDSRDFVHNLIALEITNNPLPKGQRSPLGLMECGWEDLTMACMGSHGDNVERRLMVDPRGRFHFVDEHCDSESKKWEVEITPVDLAQAGEFYLREAVPEQFHGLFSKTKNAQTNEPQQANLETYKQASRDALERFVEFAAKVEHAADLQPGTFLEAHLEWMFEERTAIEMVDFIERGYILTTPPADWRERIEAICAESVSA